LNSASIKHHQLLAQLVSLSVIFLLPFGRSSEVPFAIGSVVCIIWLVQGKIQWRTDSRIHLFFALFTCYWLAAFFSGFGAVAPEKTWETILVIFRFLFFGLFFINSLDDEKNNRWLQNGVALIISLWLIDAWIQIFTGYSLGGSAEKERLSGIFGADNLKLGPVLAVLSPFFLLSARQHFGRFGLTTAFFILLVPILMAGSRASWISFGLVCVILAWRETRAPLRFLSSVAGVAIVSAVAIQVAPPVFPGFHARIERSLLVLQGTHDAIDDAASGRLRIWRTAWEMGAAHPLTGVGVRGFRYAYAGYSQPDDGFVNVVTKEGASHAHQLLLELWSETGIMGVLCWIIAASLAIAAWRRASKMTRDRALAPALALVAMCFPLNTHLAFYSAWWGLLFWWLVMFYCRTLQPMYSTLLITLGCVAKLFRGEDVRERRPRW